MSSSTNKHILSEDAISEESGWTAYLDDFSLNRKENTSSCSSLVSDAAWNGCNENLTNNPIKRLNFGKKTKKLYSCDDDILEDTASSPVNSPKVSGFKQIEVNCNRTNYDVTFGDFLERQETVSERGDNTNGNDNVDRGNSKENIPDLKKRGLCLVPVSALMNFIQ